MAVDIKKRQWYYIQGASGYYLFALEDITMSYEKVTQVQSRLIIGVKQTLKAMEKGVISEVIIANDADQHMTDRVMRLAEDLDIPIIRVSSMKKLGMACGIDVGASTVAIKQD
ncbi:50S ribosomal protein L7ae-like protein [Lentibacillus sp. N15]|uniref:50S ribosomal protein L7ae-like protein n=1 Tax=Lentibacillus songyuanensis TaxID=3136161 RepID=UPI0031BB18B4